MSYTKKNIDTIRYDFVEESPLSRKLQQDAEVLQKTLYDKYGSVCGQSLEKEGKRTLQEGWHDGVSDVEKVRNALACVRMVLESAAWKERCGTFGIAPEDRELSMRAARYVMYFCVDTSLDLPTLEELSEPAERAIREHISSLNRAVMEKFIEESGGDSAFSQVVDQYCRTRNLSARDCGGAAFVAHGALKKHVEEMTEHVLTAEEMAGLILRGELPELEEFVLNCGRKQ